MARENPKNSPAPQEILIAEMPVNPCVDQANAHMMPPKTVPNQAVAKITIREKGTK